MTTIVGEASGPRTRAAGAKLTREAILAAARQLFAERGYRPVSLRDIAGAAGISHPALLRHFSGKESLLAEVLGGFDDDIHEAGLTIPVVERPARLGFSSIARHNEQLPGYLRLFSTLIGEASPSGHPAHETIRDRAARLRQLTTATLAEEQSRGLVGPDRVPDDESLSLIAAWDALQVIQQYLPQRVSIPDVLDTHATLLATPLGHRADRPDAPGAAGASPESGAGPVHIRLPPRDVMRLDTEPQDGYHSGRVRRQNILTAAMELFAEGGYVDTSLNDIARRVGVSKSGLYHHFRDKDALLLGVLEERDRRFNEITATLTGLTATEFLRRLPEAAEVNAREQPGLIEVYAALSCEAIPAQHAAHAHFARRFESSLRSFTALFRTAADAGELPAHRDPEHEAVWLLALWDGLQFHWLYDREGVDVAGELRRHLDDVLARRD